MVRPSSSDRKSTRLNSSHLGISYAVTLVLHPFPTRRSSDLRFLHLVAGAAALSFILLTLSDQSAWNQTTGTIRIVVPFPPGGSADILARLLGEQINKANGPTIVIRSEEHTSELQSLRHLVCRHPRSPPFPYTTLFRSSISASGSGRCRPFLYPLDALRSERLEPDDRNDPDRGPVPAGRQCRHSRAAPWRADQQGQWSDHRHQIGRAHV